MISHINIYRKTAVVIIGAGILLSILSGAAAGLIELEWTDHTVMELALKESEYLRSSFERYFRNPESQTRTALEKELNRRLNQNDFIFFEIYNADKKKLIELSLPDIEQITAELEEKVHPFPEKNQTDYAWVYHEGQLYLKFILPLQDSSGELSGYFEGIYHIKKNKTEEIINSMILSVFITFASVFLSSLALYPFILILNKNLIRTSRDLLDANISTLNSLGSSIARRDSTTNSHNYRVTIYSVRLAEKMRFTDAQIRSVIKGAFLHDVGKLGVPDSILLKEGKLNKKEFDIMKNHVRYGLEIIQNNPWLKDAHDVVAHHHERYDGKGYPDGLRRKQISPEARVFAVADVFDALTSERPYKNAVSPKQSIRIMQKEKGKHFDPEMLNAFIQIMNPLHSNILSFTSDEKLERILSNLIARYFKLQ
ncbi:MAG: HD-GYP domain-containing protein [Spirochaetia bacterium]|nr:HD-GYP domain-containing protein [Spirochaetia bacterium]